MAQNALALSHNFGDRISAAYGELTLARDCSRLLATGRWPASTAGAAWRWRRRRASIDLHVRSLVVQARSERACLDIAAAAGRWLAQALAACTQPEISHISVHLAAVVLELGHVACAEEDWPQARQRYHGGIAAPRAAARPQAQDARAGLAEVAWAEGDRAQAEQLLTAVIGDPATAAATRQRAEQLLMGCGHGAALYVALLKKIYERGWRLWLLTRWGATTGQTTADFVVLHVA